MDLSDMLKRQKAGAPCFDCFKLERASARVPPHEMLRLVASTTTTTGIREEFACDACSQRLVRFIANQIKPLPADVWRYERAQAKSVATSVVLATGHVETPAIEADLDADSIEEDALPYDESPMPSRTYG